MSRKGRVLFGAMCVIWGIPFLMSKLAVRDVGPAERVFLRCALGVLLLLPVALARRELRASFRPWRAVLVYTAVEMGVPWLLLSDAERSVDSSLTGLVIAGVPLVAAHMVRIGRDAEKLTGQRVLGLVTGFAGVALRVGFRGSDAGLRPMLELLVVVVCYASGPLVVERRLAGVPRYGVVTASLLMGTVLFAPVAVPSLSSLARDIRSGPMLAVLGLAAICTALAFDLFFALIAEVGGSRATVITFVNPAVAVLLGYALLNAAITWVTGAAFALILAGSVLSTRRPTGRATTAPSMVDAA